MISFVVGGECDREDLNVEDGDDDDGEDCGVSS